MDLKKSKNISPRIKVIQKLYNSLMNSDSIIDYPKSQYKKFIKDVVTGTLERSDLIEETINTLSMASPFSLEEKQVLLESKDLTIRKDRLKEILNTYILDNFNNKTLQ